MATEVGELLVTISTDLSEMKKGLEEANAKVAQFGAGTVAKGNLIADALKEAGKVVLKFGKDSLLAYGESQEAITRLELALKNSGQEVEKNSKRLQDNATQLQKMTGVEDEAIISTQALLTTFGIAGKELDSTTRAALDLSKGLGVDLRSATMLLGKAAVGETSTLARYGIVIDENVPKSKKFETALKAINDRFGGQAQANVEGVNGKLQVLAARFNDLQELIGKKLVPALDFWGGALNKIFDMIEKANATVKKELSGRELTIRALKEERAQLLENVKARGSYRNGVLLLSAEEQRRMVVITNALNREKALLQESVDAVVQANTAKETSNKERNGREKLMEEQAAKERKELAEKEQKENEKRNKERAENFRDTLNFISSLASEKNKVLAAIGKAAAISTATIDTFAAANKALASAPPPFNFGLAAAVTAAGIANVAKISGVKLAKGGIVEAREGGTPAVLGEAGQSEAVIPLGDRQSKKMLGDAFQEAGAGGGMTLQFNISGHFLEGSPSKLQRMIREAVIPEIRRYSEVNPQSSFIRRRGQR